LNADRPRKLNKTPKEGFKTSAVLKLVKSWYGSLKTTSFSCIFNFTLLCNLEKMINQLSSDRIRCWKRTSKVYFPKKKLQWLAVNRISLKQRKTRVVCKESI